MVSGYKNTQLSSTKKKTVNNGGSTFFALPTTGNNNGTGGLYGQYANNYNYTPTNPVGAGTLKDVSTGLNGTGLTGNIYGDVLTPNLTSNPTTPIYGDGLSLVGGGSVGGNLLKPVDPSQYFDGGVVGTVGGGFSCGGKSITDEGEVIGGLPNADDVTFDNNGFKGTGEKFFATGSGDTKLEKYSYTGDGTDGGGEKVEGGTDGGGEKVEGGTDGGGEKVEGGTDGEPKIKETPTMTYEQWTEEQKKIEKEKLDKALKEAEIYKERAAADAQASYMQNMSTYGVNAENMAQMGLTGGGYSDYLNAQAYAQKRSDLQTADRNKIAMEQQAQTTYADGIAALNKDLFTYQETQRQNKTTGYNTLLGYAMDSESGLTEELIRAMGKNIGLSEEEIQSVINTMNTTQSNAKGEYANNAFTALITNLQNPNAYGNYSEASIRALGKQWGWTDEQIQQAVDIWSDTKKGAEVSLDGESESLDMSQVIKDIQDGLYVDNSGNPHTWEYIHELILRARNAGEKVTDEDITNAKKAYDRWIFYKQGNVTTENYYDAQYGDEEANTQITRDMTTEQLKQDAKNKVGDMLGYAKGYYDKYGALDIYASGFKPENFGDFNDIDDPDSKQGKYVQAIINDAKAGKIPVGSFVTMNYGASASDNGNYIYMGDGIFVKLPWNGSIKSAIKDYASQFGDFSVY
ncbi:MAG: hypothetical protein J6A63_08240, partial [Clostridia bacterium]|nr:hypothetical protein [Clostridia bacterium]